jgi:hypothetical protein
MWWQSMFKTIRPRNNRRASVPRKRPPSLRPAVEQLESRDTPSFINFAYGTVLSPGGYPTVAMGDFNGDGKLDLATSASYFVGDGYDEYGNLYPVYEPAVEVLPGHGDGTFGDPIMSFPGTAVTAVAAGDFDGDGQLDLVAYTNGEVNLLRGNGDGTFQPPASYPAPDLSALAVADFNGDGRPDVAVGSYQGSVNLLLNDGAGGFLPATSYAVGTGPVAIAIADFDWDGKPDLATADLTANAVSVLLNNGAGGFGTAARFGTGFEPNSIAAADFTGDGKPDLAVLDGGGGSILRGNGDGTFQHLSNLNAPSTADGLMVGDFNRDGRADLVYGYSTNYAVHTDNPNGGDGFDFLYYFDVYTYLNASVLQGHGDGTFSIDETLNLESQYWYSTATYDYNFTPPPGSFLYVTSLPAGDFNGDGYADLAAGDSAGNVAVMMNHSAPPPPQVSINNVSVKEGNSGTSNATFTVNLSAASAVLVTVDYVTIDGTATAGSDYLATSGTLTFAPGQTSKTITVQVLGDRIAEPNETFGVSLGNAKGATIAGGPGIGTILDDEPRISISDVSKKEGRAGQTTLFTFTVTLSAAYDQPVTMSFKTTNGTAKTTDNDYVAKTGTLTFAPGETTKIITIVVNGDNKKESDETFYLELFANSSNSLFTKSRGIGTILNDD